MDKVPSLETEHDKIIESLRLEQTAMFYLEQGWMNRYHGIMELIRAVRSLHLPR